MKYDMRTDPVVVARDKELAGELPAIPNPCPNVYMKWEDVVKQYPHCWVLFSNAEYSDKRRFIGGVVRSISLYINEDCVEYEITHDDCIYEYTSDGDGRRLTIRGYE